MTEQGQPATADIVAHESEIVDQTIEGTTPRLHTQLRGATLPGATDSPETEAETDEARNAREVEAEKQRAEKKSRGVQKRLDELTADKYAERAAREAAERRADQMYAELQRRMSPQGQPQAGEPRRDQFQDYEQFIEARAEYRAREAARQQVEEFQKGFQNWQQQQAAEREAQELQRSVQAKQQAYAKDVPDYFDVVNNDEIVIPPHAAAAILKHKDTAALMYHLGKNPALAESLAGLDPYAQMVAVGELAASLKRIPQVSKAPPPGKPVGPKSSGGEKPISQMSRDEYYDFITKKRGK